MLVAMVVGMFLLGGLMSLFVLALGQSGISTMQHCERWS